MGGRKAEKHLISSGQNAGGIVKQKNILCKKSYKKIFVSKY